MSRFLRVAIAQIDPTVGDLEGNAKKVTGYIKKAKRDKVDIVAFPELTLCGYPPEDLLLKGHFIRDNIQALRSITKSSSDITAIVGFVDTEKKNIYNAAAVVCNGRLEGVYRKIELPNYGVFDEKRYFTPGRENYVFRLGRLIFGVTICEDIWDKSGPYKPQADAGATVIFNISASPYHAGKRKVREEILIDRAKRTKAFIVYTNLVGGQDELVFDGGSFIFNPQGKMIVSGKEFEEGLFVTDLDIDAPLKRKIEILESRVKVVTLSKKRESIRTPQFLPDISKKLSSLEEIYRALVLGTRDYIRKNGFEKVVVGLSGGIDSSLVAVIACDAIGKNNVVGVSMPSRYSSQATKADAKILARNLGIEFITVAIDSILDLYLTILSREFRGSKHDATEENLQARIRGNILMALSNKFRWLVLTTGNKSETAVGYCTLYGDMAGGFAVIKDVPKTTVYKLARFRNENENRRCIPESIFTREPSAELKKDQKDRDTLPPYTVLDAILKSYIEKDESFEKIISHIKRPKLVKKVIWMVDRNEYKRRQSPPGVKITPKAFGRDRRLPVTNRYKEY